MVATIQGGQTSWAVEHLLRLLKCSKKAVGGHHPDCLFQFHEKVFRIEPHLKLPHAHKCGPDIADDLKPNLLAGVGNLKNIQYWYSALGQVMGVVLSALTHFGGVSCHDGGAQLCERRGVSRPSTVLRPNPAGSTARRLCTKFHYQFPSHMEDDFKAGICCLSST